MRLKQSKRNHLGKGVQKSCERKKDVHGYRENDELVKERIKVNQQEKKTPGSRGEKIKQEEIDKEIIRRDKIKDKRIRGV
jgi:ABC-type uncharacterized transport system involved in gliding motility auxiliary subunit